ncbi:MAG: F0F1 ATP synthase subunit gamma [Ruminococcaceae bacterium]|nr:F0F1 ATP synthase subunit gamma [Oscillospiraceae bacterium]
MGADIKTLRTRIKSVDSTLHLTKAMGLVASSKMRRANEGMNKGRQYAEAVQQAVSLLTACAECQRSPYMQVREEGRTRLIVIAGDRGLAGGYNANVFRLVRDLPPAAVLPIGKRACERYGGLPNSSEDFSYAEARGMADALCADFAAGEFDRLGIVSTRYVSIMVQEAQVQWVLPLSPTENTDDVGVVFEPNETQLLEAAVPEYVAGLLMAAVRESFASEVAARRTAMDSAGKNAQQMIDDLQLQYNRARQGAITQEITEIVAGSGN